MTKALWFSLGGGLAGWTAHLLLSYLLADLGCSTDTMPLWLGRQVLTVAAIVAVGATVAAARPWAGWVADPATAPAASSGRAAGPELAPVPRTALAAAEHRFVEVVALIVNTLFLFAVILAGVMSVFLAPCV